MHSVIQSVFDIVLVRIVPLPNSEQFIHIHAFIIKYIQSAIDIVLVRIVPLQNSEQLIHIQAFISLCIQSFSQSLTSC